MDMPSQLRALLEEAQLKLSDGDAADAERRAKAVSAIVRADRDVAELSAAQSTLSAEDDEEAMCAELRRRLALFVEADLADAPPEVLERIALTGSAQ